MLLDVAEILSFLFYVALPLFKISILCNYAPPNVGCAMSPYYKPCSSNTCMNSRRLQSFQRTHETLPSSVSPARSNHYQDFSSCCCSFSHPSTLARLHLLPRSPRRLLTCLPHHQYLLLPGRGINRSAQGKNPVLGHLFVCRPVSLPDRAYAVWMAICPSIQDEKISASCVCPAASDSLARFGCVITTGICLMKLLPKV